ncbi:MAG: phage holin family protein [Blastocatellia bacterium]
MKAQRETVHQLAVPESRESLGNLLGDLMTQSSDLVKDEVALVKAELHEKARLYSPAALIIAVGAAFGLLAAMALLAAGIIALSFYTGLVTSSLIFGAMMGVLAVLLMSQGLRSFKRHSS